MSPLSGAYCLIVVGEPFSEEHKKLILQKLQQGKRTVEPSPWGTGQWPHLTRGPGPSSVKLAFILLSKII